jgi:hypothetical protein
MGGGSAATGKARLRAVAATLAAIAAGPDRRPAPLRNMRPNVNNGIRVAAQYQQCECGDRLTETKQNINRSQADHIDP